MFFQRYLLNYLFIKDLAVIFDLFKHKSVGSSVIFHCYNASTILQMQKLFNDNNFRVSSQRVDQNETYHTIKPPDHEKLGIVLYTSCDGWRNVIDAISIKYAKSSFVWLIVTESLAQTVHDLSLFKIELDSDVTIVSKNESVYALHEAYHTGFNKNGQFLVREVGKWNGSLLIESKDRKDLQGLVLRSAVVILQSQKVRHKTFIKYLDEEEPDLIKTDPVHKFKGYVVLKYLRDMFNNTYKFQRTSSWGYSYNGTFDGMVGVLQRQEADIGGSPLFIRADRMEVLDYAGEAWQTKPYFIFRHPKRLGGWYSNYTRPLDISVWWCLLTLMILSAVVLGAVLHLRVQHQRSSRTSDESPSWAFLVVWSAICQQGVLVSRRSNPVKIVVFSIFMFSVIIYQYYNATILSTLLQEQPKNIKTLKDLLKSNLKVGVENILYNKDYFRRTKDPIAREIYQKKVVHATPYNYFTAEEGMAKVKKGGFAFHIDRAVAYSNMRRTFTETELCELQEVAAFAPYLAFVVAKHSPYKELIAYGVRRLSEAGLLSRLSWSWDARRPGCVRTPDSSLISVSLREFSAALVALTLGASAALFLLLAEKLTVKIRPRHVFPFRL